MALYPPSSPTRPPCPLYASLSRFQTVLPIEIQSPSMLSVVLQYVSVSNNFFASPSPLPSIRLPLALRFSTSISCVEATSFVRAISGGVGPGYVCLDWSFVELPTFQTLLLQRGLWGIQFNRSRLVPSQLPSVPHRVIYLKELVIRNSYFPCALDGAPVISAALLSAPFLHTFVFESLPGNDHRDLVEPLKRHGSLYGKLRCLVLCLERFPKFRFRHWAVIFRERARLKN